MSEEDLPILTRCGLPGIDLVPIGMHACHFYRGRNELAAAVVPYLLAGLRADERCIWVTAPPLPEGNAVQALRAGRDGIDGAIETGALRVCDFDRWYADSAGLKGLDVLDMWIDEERRALSDGYKGLRIAGNISFLQPDQMECFVEYEQAVSRRLSGHPHRRALQLPSCTVRSQAYERGAASASLRL